MLTLQQSKFISSLKVIFCFLIILLHAHYQMPSSDTVSDGSGIAYEIQKFSRVYLSRFICCIAIPGFSIISGYLFFATADFSAETYKRILYAQFFSCNVCSSCKGAKRCCVSDLLFFYFCIRFYCWIYVVFDSEEN